MCSAARDLLLDARRMADVFTLWRAERSDPGPFYSALADAAVEVLTSEGLLQPADLVLDLGSGPGWYTEALRRAGAEVIGLEYDLEELSAGSSATGVTARAVCRADAQAIPLVSGSVDGVFCSNMLEHVPSPAAVLTEIERVLRPGGWAYVSWTNWYSPWGGHDMSPYHLLGPRWGPTLYERVHGPPPKNRLGEGLFPVHIGSTLEQVRGMPGLELMRAEPRYWRRQRWIVGVPGFREVFTWNCAMHLRKRSEGHPPSDTP